MPSAFRRWIPVLAWIVVIYTTIPFVRRLREWFVGHWSPRLITWAVAAVLVSAALAAAVAVGRRSLPLRPGSLPWITVVTVVLVAWTFSLRRSPEEAVHFLEYGVLAVLIFRALRPVLDDDLIYVVGFLVGALVGTGDEIIQWFSPERYWDWRDLLLNSGAGALIQLALWRIVPRLGSRATVRSLLIVLRLTAATLLLLTLCLANTPRVVALYAPLLPGAAHLTSSINPMAEYGHRYSLPDLGVFKSRLDLESIEAEDRSRAVEVASVIDDHRQRYGEFLDTWPVAVDPFTYELRVHLFARDRNFAKARELGFSGASAREDLAIAWAENRLVEALYPTTLAHSSYVWKDRARRTADEQRDPDHEFTSAAASHLITFASEGALRALLLSLVVALVVADLVLGRYHRGPS